MSDKGFTDDEVRAVFTHAYVTPEHVKILKWAASEFLKAKPVIEWYGDEATYTPVEQYHLCPIDRDEGAKAREYLNTLNKS